MATAVFCTGYEHGVNLTTAGGGLATVVNGTPTVQSAIKHSGNYALRLYAPTASVVSAAYALPSNPNLVVGVAYIYFAAWPSIDNEVIYVNNVAGATLSIKLRAATHKLFARFWSTADGTEHATALSLNTWYRLDYRFDVSTATSKIDFQVDGVAAVQATLAQAATTINAIFTGGSNAATGDLYVDDLVVTTVSTDYPIGECSVGLLLPTSDGTHNAGTVIQNTSGTVINGSTATAYNLVDEIPATALTDYVQQPTIGTGNYAEVNFADPANTVIGVQAVLAYHSSTATANAAETRIRQTNNTDTTLYSGDMSETTLFYKTVNVWPSPGLWYQADVIGLKGRMGYASSVGSVPYWDALMLEVAYQGAAAISGSASKTLAALVVAAAGTVQSGAPVGTLSNAQTINMGTAGPLDNLSGDGFSWAPSNALQVDPYGNVIALAQDNSGNKDIDFVYSNDNGATWSSTALAQGYIERGSWVLLNGVAHVFWQAQGTSDGMIYRRYTANYDGSNHLTGFTRDTTINLQLDFGASGYASPNLLAVEDASFPNGALLAVWSVSGTGGVELRASMRVLSMTSADNVASNWIAPVSADTSSIGTSPAVPYTKIIYDSFNSIHWSSVLRKSQGANAGDVWVVYSNTTFNNNLRARRLRWNSTSHNFSTGMSTTVVVLPNFKRAGTDGGYNLKQQLISSLSEDTLHDRVYMSFSTWKDNTAGDTWSYTWLNGDDSVGTLVDVYAGGAANCAANVFITGDSTYDAPTGTLVATWTDLPNKHIYAVPYDSSGAQVESPILVSSSRPFDIPIFATGGRVLVGGQAKLMLLCRDFNNAATGKTPTYTPPYQGYFFTLDIATPTVILVQSAPDQDAYVGSWTDQASGTTALYDAVNEAAASDTDYIMSPTTPASAAVVLHLGPLSDPKVSTNHMLSYRYCKLPSDGTDTINLTVELRQGYVSESSQGTLIASWTHTNISTGWLTANQTLSAAQADAISNYASLYVRMVAA